MNKTTGEQRTLIQALSRLERVFGILPEELVQRSAFCDSLLRDYLLPGEAARISLRLNALADKAQSIQKEAEQQSKDIARSEEETLAEKQKSNTLESALSDLRQRNAALFSNNEILAVQRDQLLKTLIAFRDRQLLRESMAKQEGSEELLRVFSSLCKESLQMLEQLGVSQMLPMGSFDSALHVATDTRQTSNASLHDTIAEVFRPGYYLDAQVLRPQEVVLYRYDGSEG